MRDKNNTKVFISSEIVQVRPTDQLPEGATSPDAKPTISFVPQKKGKPPAHLVDFAMQDRKKYAKEQGFKPFRVDQLSRHYFGHYITDNDLMPDLRSEEGKRLTEIFLPELISEIRTLTADKGKTIKQLWQLYDGARVESVLMGYKDRTTLCISSQAGCGMGCPFCATGQMGLTRNLSAAEIVEQVRLANLACKNGLLKGSDRVTNIVFMGMGEPMANYKNLLTALHCLIDDVPNGFGMSARNITVSTVGLVPAINKLASEKLPVTLAISLHAPDDDLRDELIPINSRFKVGQLLDAARHYFEVTGRRVSIEYALIKNMNDHQFRAQLLADELNARGRGWAHVNPIPLNPTPGSIWTASELDVQETFVNTLRNNGISTTIRDTRGSDIDGACGQLAAEVLKQERK